MKIECWPRNVDPTSNPEGQYDGWPLTVAQKDNYARKAVGYLSTLNLEGVEDPVISVFNESTGALEYGLPVNTKSFQPKVFSTDKHRIEVADRNKSIIKTYAGLTAKSNQTEVIQVNFTE